MKLITKSSKHSTKFANAGKHMALHEFLVEYNRMVWLFVDYLWTTKLFGLTKYLMLKITN